MRHRKRKELGKSRAPIYLILTLILALGIGSIAVYFGNTAHEIKKENNIKKNLVIDIPKPCSKGIISICHEGENIYQFSGEIQIVNDGRDGEKIEITAIYPKDYMWPCSCFEEVKENAIK